VIAGAILLKSAKMARFMNQNIPGIHVPDALIKEMESSKDKEGTSAEIAARLIRDLHGLAAGVHIMAMGWEHLIPRILESSGLPAPAAAA
jgi:5,10-methylenetetrahydrofolate reductase